MKIYSPYFIFCLLVFLPSGMILAQKEPLYSYQDLSRFSYKKEKDSIKKSWVCPALYKEKATQSKFKEIWDGRTDFLMSSIEDNDYIKDDAIYNYINQIISDIVRSNLSLFKERPLLIIDRSSSVNAYSLGNNVLVVNTGLIAFSQSREELALAIAHEMAHEVLKHSENAMKERAVLLTSDEYKKSLEVVLESKYERLTKLKKIIAEYVFSRNRHNRYHEGEADSLAIIFLKNSNISFNPDFFLRLDSADNLYKQELIKPVKQYFETYNLPVEDQWFIKRTKGLSSRNYHFKDSTYNEDSLKTHPDCEERYNKSKGLLTKNGHYTAIPVDIKEKANKILIWNLFNNLNLTACLYRIFLEKDKGNMDPWYDFMTHNVLRGIYYAAQQMNRFNVIGIKPKEYISKSYWELQNMLEQVPPENLDQMNQQMVSQNFWGKLTADIQSLKSLLTIITVEGSNSEKKKANAARDFINNNPSSMYCEFAEHFTK